MKLLFADTLLLTAGRRDNMKYGQVILRVARGLYM